MALSGKAKTDYQREYMRKRRAVRPAADVIPKAVIPSLGADPGWPPRWMTPVQWRAWMHQHRLIYCPVLRLEAGIYREYRDLPAGQFNRVSKPGDPDYVGAGCEAGVNWPQTPCKL